jgi:dUTPase
MQFIDEHKNHPPLQFYKIIPEAFAPVWATKHAGCFDIKACLIPGQKIKGYTEFNDKIELTVKLGSDMINTSIEEANYYGIMITPNERILVPTGLILDIPVGYKVNLFARSGISLKQGLSLANGVGKIDSDYIDPTFILIVNNSKNIQTIFHGQRIAQCQTFHTKC